MAILKSVVFGLDRLGLRRLVAPIASVLRSRQTGGRQSFAVSPKGDWINRDGNAIIVSPSIHTVPSAIYEHWVLDNWAWEYLPQPGDTVVDIGAGVGEEAVIFSSLVGAKGRVISLEAHPRTFGCLAQTVSRSGLSNVEAKWCAISDRDGSVQIEDSASYIGNSIMSGSKGDLTVPARSIDSVLAELGVDQVALMKMNIEGAERLAVAGMDAFSSRCQHIVVSCHDFIADAGGSEQLRTFQEVKFKLQELGFEVCTRPDHPSPWGRYYVYGRRAALTAS